MSGKRQRTRLASARAYYRLAAKSERAGDYRTGKHYRQLAERLVRQDRAERDAIAARAAAQKAWQERSK